MFTQNRTHGRRALVFVAVMLAGTLAAMAADSVVVKIPFDFTAGKTPLPAGEYTFAIDKATPGIVTIQGADGQAKVFLLTQRLPRTYDATRPAVSFNVYGEKRFLSRVMGWGGYQAPQSEVERQIARTAEQTDVASLTFSNEALISDHGSARSRERCVDDR
jgi:hypothetical protein